MVSVIVMVGERRGPASLLAESAGPAHLQHGRLGSETRAFGDIVEHRGQPRRFGLGGRAARFAEQEDEHRLGGGGAMVLTAREERVAALDAMGKPVRQQEIQRPVDRDRAWTTPVLGDPVDDLVGGHRDVAGQENIQHLTSLRGHAEPHCLATGFGPGEAVAPAGMVIVFVMSEHGRVRSVSSSGLPYSFGRRHTKGPAGDRALPAASERASIPRLRSAAAGRECGHTQL